MPDKRENKSNGLTCPKCGHTWSGEGQGAGDLDSAAQAAREAAQSAQGLSRQVSAGVQGVLSQVKALSHGLGSVKQHMKKLAAAEAGR